MPSSHKLLLSFCVFCVFCGLSLADSIPVLSSQLELSHPVPISLQLIRNETVYVDLQYLQYGSVQDLTGVTNVVLRYADGANAWQSLTGSVVSATNGQVRLPWSPACSQSATNYSFTVVLFSAAGNNTRANGTIQLKSPVEAP